MATLIGQPCLRPANPTASFPVAFSTHPETPKERWKMRSAGYSIPMLSLVRFKLTVMKYFELNISVLFPLPSPCSRIHPYMQVHRTPLSSPQAAYLLYPANPLRIGLEH